MASLFFLRLLTAALLISSAATQTIPVYGQCGGLTYTGSTVCAAGSYCDWESDYFSQCVPGTAPPPYAGPINYWFPFGDNYTTTSFDPTSVLPSINDPFGNPPFPGFTGAGGENYVGYNTETYNSSVIFTYNYAYGGAMINASLVTPYEPTVLSLIDQVNEFLTGGVAAKPATTPWTSANALFSGWIGVNNLAGSYYETGDRGACVDSQTAVGARNFLFLNVPRVDLTPLVTAEGTAAQQQLAAVITDFNTRLAANVTSFQETNTGVCTCELHEKRTYHWETIIASAVFGGIRHLEAQYMERGGAAVEARKAYG
ncbi:hypothetical protein K438DRAFT_2087483 [Mycena galopus ATCC 62051]|nr:hypothetical protein K438DRAFT_2087483 [Mycena galopus ATCC 62051]